MNSVQKMKNLSARMLVLSLLVLTTLWGCKDDFMEISTTTDVNMMGYFDENPDQFSSLTAILHKTGNAGYLQTYGSYTFFAPTNEAVATYLQEKGVSTIDQLELDELKQLVRFHMIDDTISSSSFTDGKLPRVTMLGQYIITGDELINGVARIRVNRQANVIQANIRTGNGIIHTVDRMLQPASQTLAQMLESKSEYSIFTAALKETGLYNALNQLYLNGGNTERAWYTVLAQTDAVFHSHNITSYEELKAQYSTTGNPADPTDGLYLYMSYRILKDPKYLADLVSSPSHETLAPQEVITSRLKGVQVLINEDIFNGVLEPGVPVERKASDNTATNGVLHTVTSDFEIKKREPVRVFFDLADQPEIRILPQFRRPGSGSVSFPALTSFKEIYVEGAGSSSITYNSGSSTSADGYAYHDFLSVRMSANVARLVEFTTPAIVKGRYRVWIGFRRIIAAPVQVYFNNEVLPRTIDMQQWYPGGIERETLAQGAKLYIHDRPGASYARLAGTIEVETTGRHKIKFVGLTNGPTGVHQIDMIQFIPEDQDQLYPKLMRDGTLVYE
ncbi:fasciclin domain-containing protein [Pontibacter qinzhouensis]|nr:fasciclin domain-containing protein [Pontibacter qinzhouensis]